MFPPYIYQKDIPAAESRTIKAQLRSLLTNADLDSRKLEEEAHIMPKRPDAMPLLFSMKMLMLRSLRVYAPDFQLNSSENVFLLDNTFHQAFDLDWLVIMPHRPFLEKVLSRLTYLDKSGAAEGGGNEEGAQSRVEIKTDLHDLLEELAEPYKLSQLPYNVYALRPGNLRKITINDFPILDSVEDLDDVEQPETFLARSDGRFHGRYGTPLSPRVFSRTAGQANPIAFILNAANKVIAALQAKEYVLPSGIESDLCLCASIWYHLIKNAPPHRDAFLTALAAATFENARSHRRYKRKKTKQECT
ncbi:uncharacterized protein JCM10292_005174 [Rhodotorula paludigena]|uniref:uncharacterized protein n=1 Tax=Rhodotorula paludigena TaxID=86838 RepID=UPI00317620DB